MIKRKKRLCAVILTATLVMTGIQIRNSTPCKVIYLYSGKIGWHYFF